MIKSGSVAKEELSIGEWIGWLSFLGVRILRILVMVWDILWYLGSDKLDHR